MLLKRRVVDRAIAYHMSIPIRGIKERHGSWLAVVVMLNDLVLGSTPCGIHARVSVIIRCVGILSQKAYKPSPS